MHVVNKMCEIVNFGDCSVAKLLIYYVSKKYWFTYYGYCTLFTIISETIYSMFEFSFFPA